MPEPSALTTGGLSNKRPTQDWVSRQHMRTPSLEAWRTGQYIQSLTGLSIPSGSFSIPQPLQLLLIWTSMESGKTTIAYPMSAGSEVCSKTCQQQKTSTTLTGLLMGTSFREKTFLEGVLIRRMVHFWMKTKNLLQEVISDLELTLDFQPNFGFTER